MCPHHLSEYLAQAYYHTLAPKKETTTQITGRRCSCCLQCRHGLMDKFQSAKSHLRPTNQNLDKNYCGIPLYILTDINLCEIRTLLKYQICISDGEGYLCLECYSSRTTAKGLTDRTPGQLLLYPGYDNGLNANYPHHNLPNL